MTAARQSAASAITDGQWQQLAAAAKGASVHGYSPYSGFRVGAAVLASDGSIASGCNVENASFGLSVCAERNAIFRAVADGAKSIVALLIYTPTLAFDTASNPRSCSPSFGRYVHLSCAVTKKAVRRIWPMCGVSMRR